MIKLRLYLLLGVCMTTAACSRMQHYFPRYPQEHGEYPHERGKRPYSPSYENQRANASKHYQRARQFGAQGKYAAAEAQYRAALKIDPRFRGARAGHGYTLYRLGRLEEAIRILRGVVHDFPEYGDGHVWLAEALHAAGHYEEAWIHVHAAEALGYPIPEDFRNELRTKHKEPPGRGKKWKPKHNNRGRWGDDDQGEDYDD